MSLKKKSNSFRFYTFVSPEYRNTSVLPVINWHMGCLQPTLHSRSHCSTMYYILHCSVCALGCTSCRAIAPFGHHTSTSFAKQNGKALGGESGRAGVTWFRKTIVHCLIRFLSERFGSNGSRSSNSLSSVQIEAHLSGKYCIRWPEAQ